MSRSSALRAVRPNGAAARAKVAVLAVVAADPQREWRTSELVRAVDDSSVLEVVMAVADLHREGGLERTGVATYRLPTYAPRRTAEDNRRRLWGEPV